MGILTKEQIRELIKELKDAKDINKNLIFDYFGCYGSMDLPELRGDETQLVEIITGIMKKGFGEHLRVKHLRFGTGSLGKKFYPKVDFQVDLHVHIWGNGVLY